MTTTTKAHLKCDWRAECARLVTHIGAKGYVYCAEHAPNRHGRESVRRMRPWEVALLESGQRLFKYSPISKTEHDRLTAAARALELETIAAYTAQTARALELKTPAAVAGDFMEFSPNEHRDMTGIQVHTLIVRAIEADRAQRTVPDAAGAYKNGGFDNTVAAAPYDALTDRETNEADAAAHPITDKEPQK